MELSQPPTSSLSSAAPARTQAPSSGRILLVDDEPNILRSLQRVLRRDNWTIETAPDAEKALGRIGAFQPHVVMSDFRMPGMNGVEFLAQVKQLSPRTQRIMLTGQADQQSIEDAINRSEIFRFIHKPWNDAHLLLTVRSAFDHHWALLDNDRLRSELLRQNDELKQLNTQLEQRVADRTHALSIAKRDWELSFDSISTPMAVIAGATLEIQRANLAFVQSPVREVWTGEARLRCGLVRGERNCSCQKCPVREAQKTGLPSRAELNSGNQTWVVAAYPMGEADRVVVSYTDVTEEKALTRQMIETEKMAAVGQLAGGVAHEINNPLGGILAFSQLMQRDEGRTPDDLEALALIEESAVRCKRIVESLLKFSRRSRSEDRRNFELGRCVDDAVVLFRAQLKSAPRARLDVRHGEGLPELYGDPAQLSQVLLNLLQNGLQALPAQEGELFVETGRRDELLFFSVRDSGSGIRPDVLPRIFEPSFTTKPPGEGTGLGLSIAYRIVEDHGGRFEVTTEPGRGTTFTVLLPLPPAFSEHLK